MGKESSVIIVPYTRDRKKQSPEPKSINTLQKFQDLS